jgi:hypothetical protein
MRRKINDKDINGGGGCMNDDDCGGKIDSGDNDVGGVCDCVNNDDVGGNN